MAPAVTHETVKPTRHEEATTAIDREVHQDHYHTSVQPISHREVLPEKHEHNLVGVEHREHHHGDEAAVKARLEQEAARFRDKQTVAATKETSSAAPVIAGEHIHHHVHEVSTSHHPCSTRVGFSADSNDLAACTIGRRLTYQ